jgi:predicted SPOUT superfamily RNA methylase MTH1
MVFIDPTCMYFTMYFTIFHPPLHLVPFVEYHVYAHGHLREGTQLHFCNNEYYVLLPYYL